jgi:hypothetical protein
MSELDTFISVVGTLSGTIVGLVLGYWASSRIETKRQKHEQEMGYRKELTQHMDDLIKPLFHFIEELWGSLAVLEHPKTSSNVNDLLLKTRKAEYNLKEFYRLNYSQLNLLLPNSISPWVFSPIEERLNKILADISEGKKTTSQEFTLVINALMKYQKNLKKLIGYETEAKLENIYPFTSRE